MATETAQHGESGSETSLSKGAWSNAALAGTQQQQRHQLVHCEAANTGTKNMTQDGQLNIVRNTGSRKNQMQHAIVCEYI